jgi:hypothetical protein
MMSPERHSGHGEKDQDFQTEATKAAKTRIKNLSLRPCCELPVFDALAALLSVDQPSCP